MTKTYNITEKIVFNENTVSDIQVINQGKCVVCGKMTWSQTFDYIVYVDTEVTLADVTLYVCSLKCAKRKHTPVQALIEELKK